MVYFVIFDLDTTSTNTAITKFKSTTAVIKTNETKYKTMSDLSDVFAILNSIEFN